MNETETLAYLRSFPVFTPKAVTGGTYIMNLDSLRELLARLGDPQDNLRYVHIAGTNGKGSTAAFLSNIMTEAGVKTGLFTSPFLIRETEQIRIGGKEIPLRELARQMTAVRTKAEQMASEGLRAPSLFESVLAAAFLWFQQEACGLVILECGLGGRTDATNVIPAPLLAVFTSISLDHTELLGDTPEKIAAEKAGIIKPGCSVLLDPQTESVRKVISARCEETGAVMIDPWRAGCVECRIDKAPARFTQRFDLEKWTGLEIHLAALCQTANAALAARAAAWLLDGPVRGKKTDVRIAVRSGLAKTAWPGRFELMQTCPAVIADGSHNPDSVRILAESLIRYFPGKCVHFVAGVLADKAYPEMMETVMPLAEDFLTVTPENRRALPAEELEDYLRRHNQKAEACDTMEQALRRALDHAHAGDIVCIFGSLYEIGRVRRWFSDRKGCRDDG